MKRIYIPNRPGRYAMLRGFIFLLVSTLLIVGAAWYLMRDPDAIKQAAEERERQELAEQGFLTSEKELNDAKEDYQRRKSEIDVQILRLGKRESELTTKFRAKGVTTAAEIENDTDAKRMFKDIRQYRQDIATYEKQKLKIDDVLSAIDDALREIDRKKLLDNAGLSEEKQTRLQKIIGDLDDRFNKEDSVLDKLEYQNLLDDINGKKEGDNK